MKTMLLILAPTVLLPAVLAALWYKKQSGSLYPLFYALAVFVLLALIFVVLGAILAVLLGLDPGDHFII